MTMDFIVCFLFLLAGAAIRFVDGLSAETSGIRTGIRNAVTITACIAAAWWGHMGWWSLWAGGWAAASLMIGETRWESPTWQAIRFGGFGALAMLPVGISGLPYVACCIVGGLAYPTLASADSRLPRFWLFDGFEAYARLILGASVIGELAIAPRLLL